MRIPVTLACRLWVVAEVFGLCLFGFASPQAGGSGPESTSVRVGRGLLDGLPDVLPLEASADAQVGPLSVEAKVGTGSTDHRDPPPPPPPTSLDPTPSQTNSPPINMTPPASPPEDSSGSSSPTVNPATSSQAGLPGPSPHGGGSGSTLTNANPRESPFMFTSFILSPNLRR
jgi:hypothetical protein